MAGEYSLGDLAAVMDNKRGYGYGDGMWGGGGWWVILLLLFCGWGRGGFGGAYGAENVELNRMAADLGVTREGVNQISSKIDLTALEQAVAGNKDAICALSKQLGEEVADIESAICNVQSVIQSTAAQTNLQICDVRSAIQTGNLSVISALKDCCCTVRQEMASGFANVVANTLAQTNALSRQIDSCCCENRLAICQTNNNIDKGFASVNNALTQGFANIGFQNERNTSAIIAAGHADTDRLLDYLNSQRITTLQEKLQAANVEISQRNQSDYILGQLRNNSCGYGCGGCGCNSCC